MKAAVVYGKGELPQFEEIPEPVPQHEDEILVDVKAVAIKHFDKSRASGTHYSSDKPIIGGRVIGGDGVCILPDGRKVYAMGASGMLAEKATIEKNRMVILPSGIDDAVAAALPNAVIGSAMGLRFRADIQPGETVMINGATGFTGRAAVQIAKFYGAGRVIATGRNQQSLKELLSLGADEIISLSESDDDFMTTIKKIHAASPVDIVVDYLWGHSAEGIFSALKGDGSFTQRTRYVSVGSMTGDAIPISAAMLRSTDLQISGSGLGSWTREQVKNLFGEILPEMFELAANGKLKVETTTLQLKDIASLWNLDLPGGKRLVVLI